MIYQVGSGLMARPPLRAEVADSPFEVLGSKRPQFSAGVTENVPALGNVVRLHPPGPTQRHGTEGK